MDTQDEFENIASLFLEDSDQPRDIPVLKDESDKLTAAIRVILNLSKTWTPVYFEFVDEIYKLRFYNPIFFLRKYGARPPNWRIYLIYASYLIHNSIEIIKAISLCAYGKALNDWKPRVRNNTLRTEYCALKSNIYDGPEDRNLLRCLRLREFLENLGTSLASSCNIAPFSITAVCSIWIALLLFLVFSGNEGFSLSAATFINYPQQARESLYRKLSLLVDTNFNTNDSESIMASPSSKISKVEANKSSVYVARNCSCKYSEALDRRQFSFFLKREKITQLVRPNSVSLETYVKMKKIQRKTILFGCSIIFLVFYLIIFVIILIELRARVLQRIESVKCQLWQPNGTLIKDSILLRPLDTIEEFNTVKNHDGSISSYINLALLETSKGTKTFGSITLMFGTFMLMPVIIWCLLYAMLFATGYVQFIEWLKQLEKQIMISKILLELNIKAKIITLEACHDESKERGLYKEITKRQYHGIERILSATYLNLEIFLKEYEEYREFVNFIAGQVVAASILYITGSFIVSITVTDRTVILIWCLSLSITILLNAFVLICASLTGNLIELFKLISDMLAKASQNSMELTYIVRLWRRRLLTDREIRILYSIQTFGFQLSQKNLVTFNTSILGIWLLLSRSYFMSTSKI